MLRSAIAKSGHSDLVEIQISGQMGEEANGSSRLGCQSHVVGFWTAGHVGLKTVFPTPQTTHTPN